MRLDRKPELLAPAGTMEAIKAVLDAGADAVYVGGKRFNMRMHRTSYNFDDDQMAEAIQFVHSRGRKIYVTLNSLVLDGELGELRSGLTILGRLRPDAIIVQDLAAAAMAREVCVQIPLHASTMMNVHSAESATALKLMGFTRVIASRDIPMHEVRRIGESAGLETEYFVHGDMCIAHSGQCYASSILFGESANRGRCLKSCRWQWTLVPPPNGEFPADYTDYSDLKNSIQSVKSAESAGRSGDLALAPEHRGPMEGYLLARKDLCLLQHIPALVQNGIACLKLEGRMRTPEFLSPLVAIYRQAIDSYFADPTHSVTNAKDLEALQTTRVRDLSTSLAIHNPGPAAIDPTGSREPRFFSMARAEPDVSGPLLVPTPARPTSQLNAKRPELIVYVAGAGGAEAALEAGANAIYLGGDTFVNNGETIGADWLTDFARRAIDRGVRWAVLDTRVADERDLAEWRWWLRRIASLPGAAAGASTLGALQVARELRIRQIIADFSMNLTNSVAADELSTLGATQVTASIEMNWKDLAELVARCRLPVEVIVQGPLPGMVMDHCVVAAASGHSPQDVCPMDCRRGSWSMRDTAGQDHRLAFDRRCRNHLYMARDVCVLPNLALVAGCGVSGLRVEALFDSADAIRAVVAAYRRAIDALTSQTAIDTEALVAGIAAATGRPQGDGPFAFGQSL